MEYIGEKMPAGECRAMPGARARTSLKFCARGETPRGS